MLKYKLIFSVMMATLIFFLVSCSEGSLKQYDNEQPKQNLDSTTSDSSDIIASLDKLFSLPEGSVSYTPLEKITGVNQPLIYKGILHSDAELETNTLVFSSNSKDFYINAYSNGGNSFEFSGKIVNIEKVNLTTNKVTLTIEEVKETDKNK